MSDAHKRREAAIKRLEAKREFNAHAAIYAAVSILLILVWAFSGQGYFWPIWTILGWGIVVAFHGWAVYLRKPLSEEAIRREMERGG
jgi:fatty acid desaturase